MDVKTLHNGILETEEWSSLLPEPRQPIDKKMEIARLIEVWNGHEEDDFAEAAITGTIAIALKMMQKADTIDEATAQADAMWHARDKNRIG